MLLIVKSPSNRILVALLSAHRAWLLNCKSPMWTQGTSINSLRPRPNRRYCTDDIFKCIFENENEWISPRISLKFVPKVWINNIPALVQIMAWRRPGDKPLSKPVSVCLLTHIYVTRPQWVNTSRPEHNGLQYFLYLIETEILYFDLNFTENNLNHWAPFY